MVTFHVSFYIHVPLFSYALAIIKSNSFFFVIVLLMLSVSLAFNVFFKLMIVIVIQSCIGLYFMSY